MISTVERVLFLKSVDLFSDIPGEQLASVAFIANEVDFQAGEHLIKEGEIGESMYLVLSGQVEVKKSEQQVAVLSERECVGELSLLDAERRSASVIALTPTRTLCLERDDFFELLTDRREVAFGIIRILCRRLRATTRRSS